jgi:hypothetical protein
VSQTVAVVPFKLGALAVAEPHLEGQLTLDLVAKSMAARE